MWNRANFQQSCVNCFVEIKVFPNFPTEAANGLCHHSCIGLRNPQLHDIGCSAVLKGGLVLKHESDYRTKEGWYKPLLCFCASNCLMEFSELLVYGSAVRKERTQRSWAFLEPLG